VHRQLICGTLLGDLGVVTLRMSAVSKYRYKQAIKDVAFEGDRCLSICARKTMMGFFGNLGENSSVPTILNINLYLMVRLVIIYCLLGGVVVRTSDL